MSGETEVRTVWAIRIDDDTVTDAIYTDDGSDYAEQMVRMLAPDQADVVTRTETITRTPWTPAPPP